MHKPPWVVCARERVLRELNTRKQPWWAYRILRIRLYYTKTRTAAVVIQAPGGQRHQRRHRTSNNVHCTYKAASSSSTVPPTRGTKSVPFSSSPTPRRNRNATQRNAPRVDVKASLDVVESVRHEVKPFPEAVREQVLGAGGHEVFARVELCHADDDNQTTDRPKHGGQRYQKTTEEVMI